jgi:ADP-ribose pyrophosphatase
VDGEDITVHRVPLAGLEQFIADARQRGLGIDVRLLLLLGANIVGGLRT